jgi:hypothetical protein
MKTVEKYIVGHKVVTREEWFGSRKAHLLMRVETICVSSGFSDS